jgi:hypothetical protein
LISQKQGNLGIGRRAHEPQQGNEWWLKGFERALGDVGKSESERTSRSGTSTPGALERGGGGKFGALYSFFVRGEEMVGTLDEADIEDKRGKKRKSGELDPSPGKEFEDVAAFMAVRDKDERRRRRKEKESAEQQFQAVSQFLEVRDGTKKKRKSERHGQQDEVVPSPENESQGARKIKTSQFDSSENTDLVTETKEQRRERRRKRREEKQMLRVVKAQDEDQSGIGIREDDESTKSQRKAEKKRRKSQKFAAKSQSR